LPVLRRDLSQFWRSERRFAVRAVAAPPMYTTKCRIAALNEATIDLGLLLTADCCFAGPSARSIAILALGAPFCRLCRRRAANVHDKMPNRCAKRGDNRFGFAFDSGLLFCRSFGAIYRNFGARSAVLPFVPSPRRQCTRQNAESLRKALNHCGILH
jgi:hypothetical protein